MSRLRPLVLCYHAVSDSWPHALAVGPRAFEAQLRRLLARGFRPIAAAETLTAGGKTLHVTFDDAFASIERALPILERLGLRATVFACSGLAEGGLRLAVPELAEDAARYPDELVTMTWDELRALAERGIEIGSHTVSHPHLPRLGDGELERELRESRERVEDELRRPCPLLAYPFGDEDERVRAAARIAGYEGAFALPGRADSDDRYAIPRVGIWRNENPLRVTVKTSLVGRELAGRRRRPSYDEPAMASRLDRERAFHDSLVADGEQRSASRFYAIDRSSADVYGEKLLRKAAETAAVRPPDILECGCGAGSYAARTLARAGYASVSIDLSEASVDAARTRAAADGLAELVEYRVMDAERLELEADSFDLVCGNGILHHLDLPRALAEIARVLRPTGTAIFIEPLGHNPLINLYRRLTPTQRTADEHPLRLSDLDIARRHFDGVDVSFFHLSALLAVPFRTTRAFEPLLGLLDRLDRALLRAVPPARRYAWIAVLELSSPRPG